MTTSSLVKVAVDAMGGDHAPAELVSRRGQSGEPKAA